MAKQLGRLLLIQKPDPGNPGQFLYVCGFRSRNFTIDNSQVEEIDDTCQTPSNAPTRSRDYGIQDHRFSGSGRFDDGANGEDLALAAENQTVLTGWKVTAPGLGAWTGDWNISSFTFEGEIEGSVTFSCEIQQAAPVTFAAAA